MEQIRRVLEVLWELFFALVELLEPGVRAILQQLLDAEIPEGGARPLTTVTLLVVAVWLVNKAFLGLTKSTANQPMKVTHVTEKTPAQVIWEDREKRVKTLFFILVFIGVVYLLSRG